MSAAISIPFFTFFCFRKLYFGFSIRCLYGLRYCALKSIFNRAIAIYCWPPTTKTMHSNNQTEIIAIIIVSWRTADNTHKYIYIESIEKTIIPYAI